MTDSLDTPRTATVVPPPESYPYTPRWVMLALAIAFALIGYLLYALYQQRQQTNQSFDAAAKRASVLSAQLDKTNSAMADLKAELQVTAQKLGLTEDELARARSVAQALRKDQQTSAQKLRQQIGQVQQQTSTQIGQVSDALNGTKTDVDATRKDLDDTKNKLSTTMGDLNVQSGLIARNHEEVQELKRLGERNVYEFNLVKSKQPQKIGPIQLQLRKVNTKHYTYTLDVIADDKRVEKKDKTLEEPVQFYVRGARTPYEIVVYSITKDLITGYLTTPKETAPANPSSPSSH
jgi:septal ring factor EnvC (AmiA/AmiB activator)